MSGLVFDSIVKKFGDFTAVHETSLTIPQGKFVCLLGPSGCGKTTLLRMIAGLEDLDGGTIHLGGERIDQLPPSRRGIAMVFQNYALYPHMTVHENMSFGLRLAHAKKEFIAERVAQAAEILQISELLERKPKALSGGQRQRISIARALVCEPKFLVADESVAALDVSIQADILNLLKSLQKDMDITFLFISHDLSVVAHTCDYVAVMYLGAIVEMAPSRELFTVPKHPYTKALLSAIPSLDPDDRGTAQKLEGEIPSPLNKPSGCRFHTRCPVAVERCAAEIPAWRELSTGHKVACHFAE